MGYTTKFEGRIEIFPSLSGPHVILLQQVLEKNDKLDYMLTSDAAGIRWNGMEKSYDMGEKLADLIQKYFSPWGYKLNGVMLATGEEGHDRWRLVVKDNIVSRLNGHGIANNIDPSESVTELELSHVILDSKLAASDWKSCKSLSEYLLKKYRMVARNQL